MEDNTNEIYAPQGTIYGDDINDFTTPLEIIKNYKTKHNVTGGTPGSTPNSQVNTQQNASNNYPSTPAYNPVQNTTTSNSNLNS